MRELISVAIPTAGRPAMLREAIASALAQDWPAIDVLVGDDSADDSAREVCREFGDARVRYFRNEPRLGQAGNINRLFDEALGERVVVLHDDDWLPEGALRALAAPWERAPDIDASIGPHLLTTADGEVMRDASERFNADYGRTPGREGRIDDVATAAVRQMLPGAGWLMRTELARRVRQSTSPAVGPVCDFEFGLRFGRAARAIWLVGPFVYLYRQHGASESSRTNASAVAYEVLSAAELPAAADAARAEKLRRLAPAYLSALLREGRVGAARRLYFSSRYPMRHRLSVRGIAYFAATLLPAPVLAAGRRFLRRRGR